MMTIATRGLSLVVVVAVLALTGWTTNQWVKPVWDEIRATEPALHAQALQGSLGTGITFGLLGGFRAITADFLWVEMNSHWEAQNLPATQKLIDLVTTVDPRPVYFWINGARIVAYDMPHWRVEAAGGFDRVPLALRQRIDAEQAWLGLALLERGLAVHPRDPRLVLEIADIHLRRRNDLATAAEYYRLASTMPGAPYYAARIYAEQLKQLGRFQDAYEWLRALHPSLPDDVLTANADIVLSRIRDLETVLKIPQDKRYEPPAKP